MSTVEFIRRGAPKVLNAKKKGPNRAESLGKLLLFNNHYESRMILHIATYILTRSFL